MKKKVNNFLKSKALFGLIFGLSATAAVTAQTLVLPSNPDNGWYTATGSTAITGLATSMISYGPGKTIAVSTEFTNGTQRIHALDPAVGTASIISAGSVGSFEFDVAIGNWDGVSAGCSTCTSPATDFIVACAYRNASGRVVINYYDLYDDGISTISFTALPSLMSNTSIGGYSANAVHLDLIAEAGNTSITGYPFCNKFVVTWNDANTQAVYADTSTLNAPHSLLVGTRISPMGVVATQQDVSAIQRNGFNMPQTIHDIALITYTTNSAQNLYKVEWDYTANSISSPLLLDAVTNPDGIQFPRIDALDDYNTNQNGSNANYKIAAWVKNGASQGDIRTYDDLQTSLTPPYYATSTLIDISGVTGFSVYTPTYFSMLPTIALGPNLDYEVTHFSEIGTVGDSAILFMEPVNINSPQSLSGSSYYWINSNGTPLDVKAAGMCNFAASVCTPVNDITSTSMIAWVWATHPSPSTFISHVDYKTTNGSYAFRSAPSLVRSVKVGSLKIYPNPANNELVIDRPEDDNTTQYRIMDMVGKTLIQGSILSSSQHVIVKDLVPGNYILGLFDHEVKTGSVTFIKK